ncbi:glycosyltransferase [Subsaximicrobium wynnwilliamsii]|uniref:Glycosyltransferase n=1 Tax=Subsaximicrobium wynnwilliamsii TaxID=291179 RepID=A0A5C6ZCD0_9FLAO|nr:glycosyltransferase [Subsaximicrobium wynnwilliamsii]TXD81694.1 glycosyltransferase [Subsaximicrobium wynnwilliamsii]TXD87449.1 glycosyltransferase [Subsaximicrobium wynnwilliamsii]TXE01137.1 glycosyltransferase [Subsaximicrobium wynnwilliamsii]
MSKALSVLYIYRNKDLHRVENSLNSLCQQSNNDFEIIFVDYGSTRNYKDGLSEFLKQYKNVKLIYSYHTDQPWSRPKAVNIGVKHCKSDYIFVADIDMIFRHDFISILHRIKHPNKSFFFKVGFLSEAESKKNIPFREYAISFESKYGAQGLSLFPRHALNEVNGLSEFIHFWGADNDVHNRLRNTGMETIFYDDKILILHQWHLIYRKTLEKFLTVEIQLSNVLRINMQHQINNDKGEISKVNVNPWGNIITKKQFDLLASAPVQRELVNIKSVVDYFLFYELPLHQTGVLSIQFYEDPFQKTLKYHAKKMLGKTVPLYYCLKEINDKLLLHIISFYNHFPYSYKVSGDLKTITFSILK